MKKWIYVMGIWAFSITVLAGCSQKNTQKEIQKGTSFSEVTTESEHNLSQTEIDIMNYEQKYNSGEFIMEDYHALAELYAEQGKIKKQRDMLEKSCRLYDDSEAFELLQDICVNLEEEDEEIRQQAMLLCQNLETPEYKSEAIHIIESREWFDTLMPKMGDGERKYFLQGEEREKLLISVGYDESGREFSNVWYLGDESQLMLLNCLDGAVQLLDTTLEENSYEGDFTLWILDGTTGSILNEQGTFEQGVYVGEYTLKIYKGKTTGDPFDLWNNRENMNYTSYTVEADEQGQGDLEQFAAKLMPYPEFKLYQVETDSEEAPAQQTEELQVRIFDGDIQILQNGIWVNLGTLEQYIQEDPFLAYADNRAQNSISSNRDGQSSQEDKLDLNNIKLPVSKQPAASQKPTQKPAASQTPAKKPATSQTPAQQPAIQQPAAQQPAAPAPEPDTPNNNNDSGSSGGGNSDAGNNVTGSSDDGGNSGGGSDDNNVETGNETDLEWTPDIM